MMAGILIAYWVFALAAVVFTFALLARFVRAHEEIAARLADVVQRMDDRTDRSRQIKARTPCFSSQRETVIDDQVSPGDRLRLVGGQVKDGRCNLLGFNKTAAG
jgi:hypothetical protein